MSDRKRVVLEMDSIGGLYDSKDAMLGCWPSAVPFKANQDTTQTAIELMKLGATPDDIIKMKHNGVI